jgi:hypothetical protein
MQPDNGLIAHGQMQITRLLCANGLKQLVDEQRTHSPATPPQKRRWNLLQLAGGGRRSGLTFPESQVSTESSWYALRLGSPAAQELPHYRGGTGSDQALRSKRSDNPSSIN